jgi:hypothetical protein
MIPEPLRLQELIFENFEHEVSEPLTLVKD